MMLTWCKRCFDYNPSTKFLSKVSFAEGRNVIHHLAFPAFAICDTDVSWLIVYPRPVWAFSLHLGGKSSLREKGKLFKRTDLEETQYVGYHD